jgi:hypothetical protein
LRLVDVGVDDAVLGDGSDSATLVVNGIVEAVPGHYFKDRSIPDGPAFWQHELTVDSAGATLANSESSTDPYFQTSFSATGAAGTFALTGSGVELQLTSLGVRDDTAEDLAGLFGVTLPATVHASEDRLPPSTALTNGALTPDSKSSEGYDYGRLGHRAADHHHGGRDGSARHHLAATGPVKPKNTIWQLDGIGLRGRYPQQNRCPRPPAFHMRNEMDDTCSVPQLLLTSPTHSPLSSQRRTEALLGVWASRQPQPLSDVRP